MTRTKAKPGPPLRPASDATATHEDRMTITTPAEALEAASDLAFDAVFNAAGAVQARAVQNAIRALAVQAAPVAVTVTVTVKPLEWEDPCKRNNYTHVARSAYGDYYVSIDGGRHQAWLDAHIKPYEVMIGKECGDLFTAKAAAQADYAARILSAVNARPVAEVQAEAVAKVTAQRDELQRDVDDAGKKILHLLKREREAVAGAYARAAYEAAELAEHDAEERAWPAGAKQAKMIAAKIRALTPADAQAALDRRDAATREAALREAAAVASNACLYGSDGGDPTEAERLVCDEAYRRIIALIGGAA